MLFKLFHKKISSFAANCALRLPPVPFCKEIITFKDPGVITF